MITLTDRTTKMQASEGARVAKYHISEDATAHIATLLENMYKDPVLAVLREYLANAIDAHELAGVKRPVEVTLPDYKHASLIVRDFGLGLSVESTERELFGYGESGEHKRTSNDYIGGFGIGAKCGYAVASAFTYTIWHGGYKRLWMCGKDDESRSTAILTSEEPSDEPTGIEVSIPMPGTSTWAMQRAITTVVPFLDPDKTRFKFNEDTRYTIMGAPTPLIDLKATIETDHFDVAMSLAIYDKRELSEGPFSISGLPAIVQGGMVLPLDEAKFTEDLEIIMEGQDKTHKMFVTNTIERLVINVPTGTLQLNPSRESLLYSGRTIRFLKSLAQVVASDDFRDQVVTKLTDGVSPLYAKIDTCSLYALPLNTIKTKYFDPEKGLITPIQNLSRMQVSRRRVSTSSEDILSVSKDPRFDDNDPTTDKILFDIFRLKTSRSITDKSKLFLVQVPKDQWENFKAKENSFTKRAASYIHDSGILGFQEMPIYITFVDTSLDLKDVSWIKDGTIGRVYWEDIPETENKRLFLTHAQRFPTPRSKYKDPNSRRLRKVMRVATKGSEVESDTKPSRYFVNCEREDNETQGLYVLTEKVSYRVYSAKRKYTMDSYLAHTFAQTAKSNPAWDSILPKLFIGGAPCIYGVHYDDYKPGKTLGKEGKTGYEELTAYIIRRFREDWKARRVDLELILRNEVMRNPHVVSMLNTLSHEHYKDSEAAKLLRTFDGYSNRKSERVRKTTNTWISVLSLLNSLFDVYEERNQLQEVCGANKLCSAYDITTILLHKEGKLRTGITTPNPLTRTNTDGTFPTLTSWMDSEVPHLLLKYGGIHTYRSPGGEFRWVRPLGVFAADVTLRNPIEHIIRTAFDGIPFLWDTTQLSLIKWAKVLEYVSYTYSLTRDPNNHEELIDTNTHYNNNTLHVRDWTKTEAFGRFIKQSINEVKKEQTK